MRQIQWIFGLVIGTLALGCAPEMTETPNNNPMDTDPAFEQFNVVLPAQVGMTPLPAHQETRRYLGEATIAQASSVIVDVPTNAAYEAGQVWPSIVVKVVDSEGKPVVTAEPVEVALLPNADGSEVYGTTTRTAVNGVAVFDDLYVTTASDVQLSVETWGGFDGKIEDVTVEVQPSVTASLQVEVRRVAEAGENLDLTITARDQFGNEVEGYEGTVTFTSDDAQAVLPESLDFDSKHQGSATLYEELSLRTAGTQTLYVTDEATGVTASATVIVRPGVVTQISFASVPLHVFAGTIMTPAPTVLAKDTYGNSARPTAPITLELVGGSDTAELLGTTEKMATGSETVFDHVAISEAGGDYVLVASYPHVETIETESFVVCGANCL